VIVLSQWLHFEIDFIDCFVQDQMGAFQGHLQGDVLSVLLDAGVLFLLRWSLDDTSDGVMAAAIQGFAAILIVPSDKVHDSHYVHV